MPVGFRLFSPPLTSRYPVRKAAAFILPDRLAVALAFRRDHGRFANRPPRTFNERVAARIASGPVERYTAHSDKLAVRKIVAEKIGVQHLIPLYAHADRLTRDVWERLPRSFMLKPNHGSGWTYLVGDKAAEDFDALVRMTEIWLRKNYYYFYRERQYRAIKPTLLFEKLLDDGSDRNEGLADYKFFCFHGRALMIKVITRIPDKRRILYDRDWNKLDVRYKITNHGGVERPAALEEMLSIAEKLSEGIDFVRIDLYSTPYGVFFGEYTLTPLTASDPFDPPEFDAFLGNLWADPEAAHTASFERWHEVSPAGPTPLSPTA